MDPSVQQANQGEYYLGLLRIALVAFLDALYSRYDIILENVVGYSFDSVVNFQVDQASHNYSLDQGKDIYPHH